QGNYTEKRQANRLSFSVQFRDAGNCHVNFLYLIPGGIIHDSGLGKTENLLEHLYTVLGLFSVNSIGNNRRNQRIGLTDGIQLFLELEYLGAAGTDGQIIAWPGGRNTGDLFGGVDVHIISVIIAK